MQRDPIQQFRLWFAQARKDRRMDLPEAMCLSTVTARGRPSARMVLLKDVERQGFTFFTNIHSPKAKDLIARPYAALTFHWRTQRRAGLPAGRQVRIEGKVSRLPKKVADVYFATRPRDSQTGSWASRQSAPLKSRDVLLDAFKVFTLKFAGKKIPPPPHWHGFRVVPQRIEFWQEQPHRLHDRWVYQRTTRGRWAITRLYP